MMALPHATPWRVRDARRADMPRLAEVRNESWRAAYEGIVPRAHLDAMSVARSRRVLEASVSRRRQGHAVLVVEDADGPFGYALAGPQARTDLGHAGEIYEIYLRPDKQRSGAGSKLLASTLWRLCELGLTPVMLWVLARNPARRFYASCGGEPFRRERIEMSGRTLYRVAYSWEAFLPLPR
jgi:GNAT superfamily N-acetyltransferase